MSDVKQVKVDNWGIYFLQRLKHFFNRTDYCDLTLQFQDNAQLKVHRLVLSACTEYFELLERTCEMYEDCLVMPDDLQADVVVPIVNFMYTGQLEFKMDMLEKLYQTSLVMNMPVLSKLLDAHRSRSLSRNLTSYGNSHRRNNRIDSVKQARHTPSPSRVVPSSSSNKRSYSNAFHNVSSSTPKGRTTAAPSARALSPPLIKTPPRAPSPMEVIQNNKRMLGEPRPTRYELPEELDTENVFENSFSNISYASAPLMVHPETTKHYRSKKDSLLHKKLTKTSTMEIVECKKIKTDNIFQDDTAESTVQDDTDMFQTSFCNDSSRDPNQLFDQILDTNDGSKVVIETKGGKQAGNIDHAKIISEVLKKYPHLVKSSKNIKLKILNTPTPSKGKKPKVSNYIEEKMVKPKVEPPDYTYETDVLDSKEAAKLIAMGAENVKGPWICLICGTPGRALHFTSYFKFRRHLVEVHNEKCIPTICEYCGFKSYKRNYMVHHCYTQHGVQPPPQYHFPKCNQCDYIAITEGFLTKHKLAQHQDPKQYRCNVCLSSYTTTGQLIAHLQKTNHKYANAADKKTNLQCIYCLKIFLRETNLYTHLRTNHKLAAKRDGLIDDSDDEKEKPNVKSEAISYDNESEDGDVQYQIHQRADGVHQVHVVSKKPSTPSTSATFNKQKILNPGFSKPTIKTQSQKAKPVRSAPTIHNEFMQDEILPSKNTVLNEENVIFIDNVEYVMKNNELIPRKKQKEYVIPEMMDTDNHIEPITPSTSMQFANIQETDNLEQAKMIIKKSNMNQPIQIVVSNEEEYKALMSSNHSIIFDDGDSNKTLTMMTNPHNTTLDTTGIDLDSTQSNDMMIIQDDYPLNVSEAVGTDNNIVVVYSHQVGQVNDDPNKQYQIITSQDIGAQFIQSSAMITQNYETVTTSTPVMSAHVIDSQVDDSWQNNSQQNIENQIHITSEAQLQSLTQIKDVSGSLIDLPEVEISALQRDMPAEITAIENNSNQSDMICAEMNQNIAEQNNIENTNNVESISVPSMATENPNTISKKEIDNTESPISTDQINTVPMSENNIVPEQINNNPIPIENQEANEKMEKVDETVEQLIDSQIELNNDLPKNTAGEIEPMQVSSETVQECVDVSTNVEPAVIHIAKEQIQNLASEWSDEEFESAENANVSKENPKELPGEVSETAEDSQDLEESIENIQHEVEKQTSTAPVEDCLESTLNDSTSSDFKEPEATSLPQTTQPAVAEKLSSLLNDWEDNDSQEDNSTTENESENVNAMIIATKNDTIESELENAEVLGVQEENGDSNENEATDMDANNTPSETVADNAQELEKSETEIVIPEKVDKIQSLVSDWDDDEEENKE